MTNPNPEAPRKEPRANAPGDQWPSLGPSDVSPSARRAERRAERDERRTRARRRRLDRTFAVARGAERAARVTAHGARVTARGVARAPVVAVVTPARAVRDIGRYWHAERRTLRQGFTALSVASVGNLLAGLALGAMSGRLLELPALLILVPAANGMRGNIFGALGSRLGTSIQLGLFRFTWDRNGSLYQNAYAATLLSLITSAYLAVLARFLAAVLGLPAAISIWDFMAISVVAGAASGVVILALTIVLVRIAAQRDWDLDAVAAPVITFIGDIVTLPALFAASFLAREGAFTTVVGVLSGAGCIWALVGAMRTRLPQARKILRESVIILALAGFVSLIAGSIIERRASQFLALPALLVVLPSFLEDAGALGGIVSSRLASKLHLGSVRPRLVPERLALLDVSLAAPFALSVFTLLGISAHFVAGAVGLGSPGLGTMVGISLVGGYIATLGAAIISYVAAVATFRFGLDPDSHGIPIVTSSMDLIGTTALVAAIAFFGVQ